MNNNCFVAKENGNIIQQIGQCHVPHSPFSTFKIPLAVIAFDAEIIHSGAQPQIKYNAVIQKKYIDYDNFSAHPAMHLWKKDHTPLTWMHHSVVWYSRFITRTLGIKKLHHYINLLGYGNKDLSGTIGQNDGLMNSWLGSSLKISPIDQVNFLEKLLQKSLPVSKQAQRNTIKLVESGDFYDDWKLHGKTGGGSIGGWFIGWIHKNGRCIIFAQYIDQLKNSQISPGQAAKVIAQDNLKKLIAR